MDTEKSLKLKDIIHLLWKNEKAYTPDGYNESLYDDIIKLSLDNNKQNSPAVNTARPKEWSYSKGVLARLKTYPAFKFP